jgi:hypothetical protein
VPDLYAGAKCRDSCVAALSIVYILELFRLAFDSSSTTERR